MRALIAAGAVLALTGCPLHNTKPDLPGAGTIVKPTVVTVVHKVYVPIPDALTREQSVAEGPLSQCPTVAAQRKASVIKLNAQLRQIRSVQGTAVSNKDAP